MLDSQNSYALSLSRGCPYFQRSSKNAGLGFDKLSPNGNGGLAS